MIQQINDVFQRRGHFLGLFLTFFGSLFQLLYLSNVEKIPFYVLEISVFMISIGMIFLYKVIKYNSKKTESFFLFSVYIMYFSLTIMPFVRFNAFSGIDNLQEYRASEITLAKGWNTPASIQTASFLAYVLNPYLSCLSITLLPSILSKVSGLDLITIFEFSLNTIVCLKPILIYLNVKEIFKRKDLAALSAIIYAQLYFVFTSYEIRGSLATIFLLCVLFVLFKLIREPQRMAYYPLLFMFIYGIVISYYTITYISNIIFLAFILILYLTSRTPKKWLNLLSVDPRRSHIGMHLSQCIFTFCIILSSAWFSFVQTSPFFEHLKDAMKFSLTSLRTPGDVIWGFFGSPLGPLVDNWFRFELVLAILGFLFLALRERKSLRMFLWLSVGGLFFLGFLITFFPFTTIYGGFLRVYLMGYPFLCSFVAFILLKLDRRSKGTCLILFLLINLPMNMLLPINYRYVLYHAEESISPNLAVTQNYVSETEFEESKWIRNFVPFNARLSTDQRSFFSMYYTNNPLEKDMPFLDFFYNSKYLVLHHFAIKYGLYEYKNAARQLSIRRIINSNNIIYNNGREMLLWRK